MTKEKMLNKFYRLLSINCWTDGMI